MKENDIQHIRFSGLLHDIGKFQQRGLDNKKEHSRLARDFIAELGLGSTVSQLVAQHHTREGGTLAEIIRVADHLSARERKEYEKRPEVSREPLRAIFSQLSIKDREVPEKREWFYPLSFLQLDDLATEKRFLYPKDTKREALRASFLGGASFQDEYAALWEKMTDELKHVDGKESEPFFTTLYYLLMKYTSQIPAAARYTVPDISLFDHLRATAAIAECLYRGNREELLLVGGDLSGIQTFIYNLRKPGEEESQAHTAKRLRGRSYFLSLLTESVADYLLDELNLSVASKLWCSGGHFYLLAPTSAQKKVETLKQRINKYLFEAFEGDLFFSIASCSFKRDRINEEFHKLLGELNDQFKSVKHRKFANVFSSSDFVLERKKGTPCKSGKFLQNSRLSAPFLLGEGEFQRAN